MTVECMLLLLCVFLALYVLSCAKISMSVLGTTALRVSEQLFGVRPARVGALAGPLESVPELNHHVTYCTQSTSRRGLRTRCS